MFANFHTQKPTYTVELLFYLTAMFVVDYDIYVTRIVDLLFFRIHLYELYNNNNILY